MKPLEKKKAPIVIIEDALDSRFFRRFMSVAYGLGASVVIIGALFKITHIRGANEALFVGMVTEAIIFALSALQKPHVEPDWSKVHPQFKEDYHGIKSEEEIPVQTNYGGQTGLLDKMLQNAKVDQGLIDRLGSGLKNLSDTTLKLNDVSNASLANQEFVGNIKSASQSAVTLSKSYAQTADALNQGQSVSTEFSNKLKEVSTAASGLKDSYAAASQAIITDVDATKKLSESINSATASASKLSESYLKSSENIAKNIDELQKSIGKNLSYNTQLTQLSENLASLNAMYELQLKNSEQQSAATSKLQDTLNKFLVNLENSTAKTDQYQKEMEALTRRMSTLNNIYGNMLSAMNVK